jgi:predicted RNA-binding Zn ribbon-like protein
MVQGGKTAERTPSREANAVIELVNSRAHAWHADRFDDLGSATEVARLFAADVDLDDAALVKLRLIREHLTHSVTDPAALPAFSEAIADVRFQQVFAADGTTHSAQVAGDPVAGGVATAVATLIQTGDWNRVKLCANEVCSHAFYDTTRNRLQKWDSYELCGNRINVAAYRARHRND